MAVVSKESDIGERMGISEGDKPTAGEGCSAAETKAPSLKQRMAAMRNECAGIGKEDIRMEKDGKKWTIKGHTVEAVLSEIRPLLDRYGLDVTPNLVERTYSGNRCDVIVDFLWERTDDSDEQRTIRWFGADTDNGGKAAAKAGTNALKEHLKKKFLITDRDDAKEETDSVDHQTDEGLSRQAMEAQKEQKRAAVELWAKAVKMALEKASTSDEVKRIERDNKEQLTSPELPSVTRTFFVELIERRKKELEFRKDGDESLSGRVSGVEG